MIPAPRRIVLHRRRGIPAWAAGRDGVVTTDTFEIGSGFAAIPGALTETDRMNIVATDFGRQESQFPRKPDESTKPEVTVETIVARLQAIQELPTLKVSMPGIVDASQPGRHSWEGESRLVLLVRG